MNPGSSTLLKGVVGSRAFGLANENSDYDYQGIFVAPTEEFLSVFPSVQDSYNYKNPDTTYHEVGKFCKLALGCNPTVLDLLWLDSYNVRTQLGTELINLRNNFLSAPRVRGAYFGYANDQYDKLLKDSRREKRAKNARHFLRLLEHGTNLYLHGTYSVKVKDPEEIIELGYRIADGEIQLAKHNLSIAEIEMSIERSPLPAKPNLEPINEWLLKVRHEFYQYRNQDLANNMEEFKAWP
jgi:predicted nucleotidyltransferase